MQHTHTHTVIIMEYTGVLEQSKRQRGVWCVWGDVFTLVPYVVCYYGK